VQQDADACAIRACGSSGRAPALSESAADDSEAREDEAREDQDKSKPDMG
jgi:hypothetical protein